MTSFIDDESSLTPFRKKVYKLVHQIPKGKVRSYGSIAKELQTSARATAMGSNSWGPCDKVP